MEKVKKYNTGSRIKSGMTLYTQYEHIALRKALLPQGQLLQSIRMSTKRELRVPPQDLDAERAVLGSIMLRPDALHEIDDFINGDSFYGDRHRHIWKVIIELREKGEPIDVVSVSTRLRDKELLDMIGGASALTEIMEGVPSSTNVGYYADIIYKKCQLRRLVEAAETIATMAFGETSTNLDDLLDHAEKKIFGITTTNKAQRYASIRDSLSETWEELSRLHENPDAMRGVPTGFESIDAKLSGLQKSDLVILAARPSVGKTTLALDIARNAAVRANTPVVIFSLEMSTQQLVTRMLATEARVDAWKLRTGKLDDEDAFTRIRDALDRLSKAPIYINDEAGNSTTKMKSFARRIKSEHGLGLIIVDYLQLMTTSKNYDSMVNQVTEISRSLKSLARELDVPVLALSQLSRAVEQRGGKPRLSDLRDSGSIEQDADVVMFIHRDDRGERDLQNIGPSETTIIIAKHRNGPVGEVPLVFDPHTTTFHTMVRNMDAPQYVKKSASVDDVF